MSQLYEKYHLFTMDFLTLRESIHYNGRPYLCIPSRLGIVKVVLYLFAIKQAITDHDQTLRHSS